MDACILELGTRSFGLLHARLGDGGRLLPVHSSSEPVDIEAGVGDTGTIGGSAWRPALRAMDRLVGSARTRSRSGYIAAVAPNAFGGATDALAFAAAAARRSGVCPLLLTPADTARLSYEGARAEASEMAGHATVIDVGETALDLMSGRGATCDAVDRTHLGIRRLFHAFGDTAGEFLPADAPALVSLVRLSAGPAVRRIRDQGQTIAIFTSEIARDVFSVAEQAGCVDAARRSVERVAFHSFVSEILEATPRSLEAMGIEAWKSPLLATAGIVIDTVADMLRQRVVRFGTWGVPEGVALTAIAAPRVGRRLAG